MADTRAKQINKKLMGLGKGGVLSVLFSAVMAVGLLTSSLSVSPVRANHLCDPGYTQKAVARIFRYNVINAQSVAVQGDSPDDRGFATAFKMTATACYNGNDSYPFGEQVVTQVGVNPNLFIRKDDCCGYSEGPFYEDLGNSSKFWHARDWTFIAEGFASVVYMRIIFDKDGNVSPVASFQSGPDCGLAGCFSSEGRWFTLNQYDWE